MNTMSRQSGAVSLFVVVFATLLITVVTVSFLRIMMNDQNQASNNDLSQSAYDSAQAGVEDAKRALLGYQQECTENGQEACDNLADDLQLNSDTCNTALEESGVIPAGSTSTPGGEVRIQQSSSSNDGDLDQAYTCVTMQLSTDDYVGSLAADGSKLVPLIGKSSDGDTTFSAVTIEWFTTEDISSSPSGSYALSLPAVASAQTLPTEASWAANRPALLRTQLMQFGDNFTLDDFDSMTSSGESNANTLFLYPTSSSAASSHSFTARDARSVDGGPTPQDQRLDTPLPVQCQTSLSSGGYACQTTLNLPTPIGGGDRTAFLRVTALYNASHFRVTLQRSGSIVPFNGVQPEIDSTGRANDLFRRVVTRVDLIDTNFPYPEAAVDVTGPLCKDFAVTDTQYFASNTCTP